MLRLISIDKPSKRKQAPQAFFYSRSPLPHSSSQACISDYISDQCLLCSKIWNTLRNQTGFSSGRAATPTGWLSRRWPTAGLACVPKLNESGRGMTLHNAWTEKSPQRVSHPWNWIHDLRGALWHRCTCAELCNTITSASIRGYKQEKTANILYIWNAGLIWTQWGFMMKWHSQKSSAGIWNWSPQPIITTACTHGVCRQRKRQINEEKVAESLCVWLIHERRRVTSSTVDTKSSCTLLRLTSAELKGFSDTSDCFKIVTMDSLINPGIEGTEGLVSCIQPECANQQAQIKLAQPSVLYLWTDAP